MKLHRDGYILWTYPYTDPYIDMPVPEGAILGYEYTVSAAQTTPVKNRIPHRSITLYATEHEAINAAHHRIDELIAR